MTGSVFGGGEVTDKFLLSSAQISQVAMEASGSSKSNPSESEASPMSVFSGAYAEHLRPKTKGQDQC